jgi:hypothetical protein
LLYGSKDQAANNRLTPEASGTHQGPVQKAGWKVLGTSAAQAADIRIPDGLNMGEGFTAFSCGNELAKAGKFIDLGA